MVKLIGGEWPYQPDCLPYAYESIGRAMSDGDGIHKVHNNTMEGIWIGRNFLRLFSGISKWFLAGYITVFEYNTIWNGSHRPSYEQ